MGEKLHVTQVVGDETGLRWWCRENGGKTPWDGGPLVNPIYTWKIVGIYMDLLGRSPFKGLLGQLNS